MRDLRRGVGAGGEVVVSRLRGYQLSSISRLRTECQAGRKPILVMPTGSGKTKTAVYGVVAPAIAKGKRVLWLAHRTELIEQAKKACIPPKMVANIHLRRDACFLCHRTGVRKS